MERVGVSETGAPSRTAMMAACARGWHLFNHGPRALLADWLAWPLAGGEAEALIAGMVDAFGDRVASLAAWTAARSRFVEDWLAQSGADQYVILGAGLDSFAWRQRGEVRVFEVDHPATQAWKRSRLKALGISAPSQLVWVPVDFEVESVADGLARAGFGSGRTFVSWLGVTPYLSLDAIAATLRALPRSSLAVSYVPGVARAQRSDALAAEERSQDNDLAAAQAFQRIAAQVGEPILSLFTPGEFEEMLAANGFDAVEDVGSEDVQTRYDATAFSLGNERVTLARSKP